jgi:hypothetical protein
VLGSTGKAAEQMVKQIEAHAPQAALAARPPRRAHDFRPGLPGCHQLWNQLRRILQIRIHRHHRLRRTSLRDAGGKGTLEAKVAGEGDEQESRILVRLRPDQFGRAIVAAVVDENGAPVAAALAVKDRSQPEKEFRQHRLFVEDGRDDGDLRAWGRRTHARRRLMTPARIRRKRGEGGQARGDPRWIKRPA